ncbi:MAG: 5-formyltetrahydrofolate cyclo-ligase [Candidatus Gallimonas sp.]
MSNDRAERERLRKEIAALRGTFKTAEAEEKIVRNFFSSPYAERGSFFVYHAVRTEADTSALIARLLAAGKTVCLPRVFGREMRAVRFRSGDALVSGAFGIAEPTGERDEPCEVALTPLLAADLSGTRLGYGGGYYDRYFAAHPTTARVGICFEGQVVSRIPRSAWDVPLDALITEAGVYRFREKEG